MTPIPDETPVPHKTPASQTLNDQERDERLEEALEESFPASDPASVTRPHDLDDEASDSD